MLNQPAPSLPDQIGQMLLAGFRGCEIGEGSPIARDLAQRNLGGVILFDEDKVDSSLQERNIRSPAQARELADSLRQFAKTPLWIAVDQEGGRVNRLKQKYGFLPTISHAELGEINNPEVTRLHADQIARTFLAAGFNLNLAPVVDVARPDNPIIGGRGRSFSSDPEVVAQHAIAFARAHHQHGVLTCAKHFPGHGSARGDTHLGLVDVTQLWTERELIPFSRLIEAKSCPLIMTAHVFNARLDPGFPATLSKPVITGLLRDRLGFEGVVVSDDLDMRAIASRFGLEEAILRAIDAGVDLLCFGNNQNFDEGIVGKAMEIILRLVTQKKLSEARINQSYQRIQALKHSP